MGSRRFLLALVLLAAASPAAGSGTARFGEVHILRKEIFNPSVPGYDRFPYSWLNALHVCTREPVIREALLFRPGDPFDPELLEDTERALRTYTFINFASVVAADRRDSLQDVVVETHDSWSTELTVEFGNKDDRGEGGEDRLEVTIEEQNLFGFGKRVELSYRRADGDEGFGWLLFDPQLLGTRWTGTMYDRSRSPGRDRGIAIARPIYSLASRWGAEAASVFFSGEDRTYRRDKETSSFFRESRRDNAQAGRMLGPRHNKFLLRVLFAREDTEYSDLQPVNGEPPDSSILDAATERIWAAASVSYGRFAFREEKGIDYMDRIEDVDIGGYGALTGGPLWGEARGWRLRAESHIARRLGEHRYAAWFASCSTDRLADAWGPTSLGIVARYHELWTPALALAGRAAWEETWRAQPGRELFADAPNGLRGYDAQADAGARRFLLNAETRLDTGVRILTVGLGGVLFFDAGAAWDTDEPVRSGDLGASVGAGLRLGLTKTRDGKTLRLDVARNLRDGSWRADFDVGHLFSMAHPFNDFRRSIAP